MDGKVEDLLIERVKRWSRRCIRECLCEKATFSAEFSQTKEPVPLSERDSLSYKAIKEGEEWGEAWDCAWFHLVGTVPNAWAGKNVVAVLDLKGEGLVFDDKGECLQGISSGSVFDANFTRTVVPVKNPCAGGESVELWVDAAANGLFGVNLKEDPAEDDAHRHGTFTATVETIQLRVFNEPIWELSMDLKVILGLISCISKESVQRSRVIDCANRSLNAFLKWKGDPAVARSILRSELSKKASESDLSVVAVGHAHIDTAWLWPVRETIRKVARTYASQLRLIENNEDYVFGASGAQHYLFMKDYYPDIYKRVKSAFLSGQWEPQGGMFVEADCNIPSGESLVRQILMGKNFFMDEFGMDVTNCWLPDGFGFPSTLPQILTKSGIRFFLTQKLSWNQFNEFPFHSFVWRGLDGSEVIAHFLPENTYNSDLDPQSLVRAQTRFKEKRHLNSFLSVFGVGDGGGGPKDEMLAMGKRLKSLESVPKVVFGKASDFFEGLERFRADLKTWVGELYLELHRGTFTTQARTKKANRMLENKLCTAEMLFSFLPWNDYPYETLQRIWKALLLNQFHDIIPGSSIHSVYSDTSDQHQWALESLECLFKQFERAICVEDALYVTFFNPNHYEFDDFLTLADVGTVRVSIPPYSFKTVLKNSVSCVSKLENGLELENDLIRYRFDVKGRLLSAYDKELGREMILSEGNVFAVYDDHPNNWDAWDIDLFYEGVVLESPCGKQLKDGPGVSFRYSVGKSSSIEQTVVLAAKSKRLNFQTKIDWHEKHRMLRVSFDVDVHAEQASFDVNYGTVKRPVHRNTSWDVAKFESVAHRFVDLSEEDFGVALLNDCKYGHKVYDTVIDLNLLRAPTYPDADADMGVHTLTYAFLPHCNRLIESSVLAEAAFLNRPIVVLSGKCLEVFLEGNLGISLTGDGLSLETMKRAEKDPQCSVVRVLETKGKHSRGVLSARRSVRWTETNLMEWEDGKTVENGEIAFQLSPFELRTWKVRLAD